MVASLLPAVRSERTELSQVISRDGVEAPLGEAWKQMLPDGVPVARLSRFAQVAHWAIQPRACCQREPKSGVSGRCLALSASREQLVAHCPCREEAAVYRPPTLDTA